MRAPPYSLEAWRRYKEGDNQTTDSQPGAVTLADITPDAEMDEGIVIGYWNGECFVSWKKWIAIAPIERDAATEPVIPTNAKCVTAICGHTQVRLVRDSERWLMFVGTRASRRNDFATPFLNHAQRTAEAWYGAPEEGWFSGVLK